MSVQTSKTLKAFDAQAFRHEGHAVIDALAQHLGDVSARTHPVLPWREPEDATRAWATDFSKRGMLADLLSKIVAESNHLHHPHYVGHQVTSPLPLGALGHLVATLLNNSGAVYEMSPVATPMEHALVRWMSQCAGWEQTGDGILTSGGSLGNLTALLAMRQVQSGYDVWSEGARTDRNPCVIVSDAAHYSVARSVQIMGWGKAGVVRVPVDENFRLNPEALPTALDAASKEGRQVLGVVASSGSTATGSFDPLDAIADFCQKKGLWLHVDGAHGGSALLSKRYQSLVNGMDRVDSLVWDLHKVMLLPALATAVLYRNASHSYQAFAQEASYLFERAPQEEWYNLSQRTFECTKPSLSIAPYLALSVYGPEFFGDYVTQMFDLAKTFAQHIREAQDFELAIEPQCNIVCFRYVPQTYTQDAIALDDLQKSIRKKILREGSFYFVQTRLPKGVFLRTTLLNPRTTEQDLGELLTTIRATAQAL